jgi:hypothetical protein
MQRDLHAASFPAGFDDYYQEFTMLRELDVPDDYAALWNGIRVRVGINTGPASAVYDPVQRIYDYYGSTVNSAARIESVGHGGQIVVAAAVLEALSAPAGGAANAPACKYGAPPPLPAPTASSADAAEFVKRPDRKVAVPRGAGGGCLDGCDVYALGAPRLRGVPEPLPVFQIDVPGLERREVPPLRVEPALQEEGADAMGGAAEREDDDTVAAIFEHAAAATRQVRPKSTRSRRSQGSAHSRATGRSAATAAVGAASSACPVANLSGDPASSEAILEVLRRRVARGRGLPGATRRRQRRVGSQAPRSRPWLGRDPLWRAAAAAPVGNVGGLRLPGAASTTAVARATAARPALEVGKHVMAREPRM